MLASKTPENSPNYGKKWQSALLTGDRLVFESRNRSARNIH